VKTRVWHWPGWTPASAGVTALDLGAVFRPVIPAKAGIHEFSHRPFPRGLYYDARPGGLSSLPDSYLNAYALALSLPRGSPLTNSPLLSGGGKGMVDVSEVLEIALTGPFLNRIPPPHFPYRRPPNWRKEKLGGFSI
jgi:hypothetical protein